MENKVKEDEIEIDFGQVVRILFDRKKLWRGL